jgi:hypothetical protein
VSIRPEPADGLPWRARLNSDDEVDIVDCHGLEIATVGPRDAALIVAAVNALAELDQ